MAILDGRFKPTKGLALFSEQLAGGSKKSIPNECEFDIVPEVGQSCLFKAPEMWINAFQDVGSPFIQYLPDTVGAAREGVKEFSHIVNTLGQIAINLLCNNIDWDKEEILEKRKERHNEKLLQYLHVLKPELNETPEHMKDKMRKAV